MSKGTIAEGIGAILIMVVLITAIIPAFINAGIPMPGLSIALFILLVGIILTMILGIAKNF